MDCFVGRLVAWLIDVWMGGFGAWASSLVRLLVGGLLGWLIDGWMGVLAHGLVHWLVGWLGRWVACLVAGFLVGGLLCWPY